MADPDFEPAELKLTIDVLENTNFGDHGAMMRRSHVHVPGETLEHLVYRLMPHLRSKFQSPHEENWIEIRVQIGVDGKLTGTPPEPKIPPF